MDKVYIGSKAAEFLPGLEALPITKVELLNENGEIMGQAGDDTGRVLTAENPDGTDAIAADILAAVGGFVYRPYEAEDALIDPAAELGDGVTIGGIYSVLANENIVFDGLYSATISAPTTDEIEDEYPYLSEYQRIQRSIAGTRSLVTKTAEQIRMEVAGKIDGEEASALINTAIGEITLSVSSAAGGSTFSLTSGEVTISTQTLKLHVDAANIDGKLTASQIDATELTVDAANVTGTLKASQIDMTGAITWAELSTEVTDDINDCWGAVHEAYVIADSVDKTVSGWTYPDSTYIDGSMIMTGTVMASYLLGGYVGLLNRWEDEIGELAIGSSSSSDYSIELKSTYGALRLVAGGGDFWIDSYSGSMGITDSGIVCGVPPVPQSSGNVSLGTYSFKWSQVYAATGTINTSDREEKNSIDYDMVRYDKLFDGLKPCSYKLNDGTSNRFHVGMISQDVEECLGDAELTSIDFAGFIKSPKDEGGYAYGLRYSEFIALNIWQIQKLKARVAELEAKIYDT